MTHRSALIVLLAAAAVLVPTATGAGAAVPPAPSYVATIGGPGHAEMYASGGDVDATGNLYIADTGNDQVDKYSPDGQRVWVQGTRGSKAPGNFDNPRDLAYLNGKLYVADLGNKRVQVLNAGDGSVSSVWPESFPSTIGISAGVDANGNDIILVTEDVLNQTRIYTPSGTFIRAVGTGVNGSGDGQLAAPRDAATDSAGNIYVADYANNRIAKFSPTGAWITSWGSKGGKDGQFRRPYGIAVDAADRVWVADNTNHRIQEFTASGGFIQTFGTPGTDAGQFFQLRRVAVTPGDTTPDVYGFDLWGNKVEHYTPDGHGGYVLASTFGNVHAPDQLFNEAAGVAVDANNIFVADSVNQRMQRFDTGTRAWQLHFGLRGWGNDLSGLNWPRDIAISQVDPSKVWVADTKNGRMLEFTRDGDPTGREFGAQGSALGDFSRPSAIAPTADGLIVADTFNNRVQLWNTSGATPAMVWNATGFNRPLDVAVSNGVVYVADSNNHRVVKLSESTGNQLGTFGVGTLHSDQGLAVDPADGSVWVADTSSNRLVEFSASGDLIQTFGTAGTGNTQFDDPTHLEIFAGKLYVCDTFNDRVQVYDLGHGSGGGSGGTTEQMFSGSVSATGTVSQRFTIQVTDTSVPITASLDWTTTSANLNLFLTAPGSSAAVAQATSKTARPEQISYMPTVPGTYTLRVKAVSGSSAFTLDARWGGGAGGAGLSPQTFTGAVSASGTVSQTFAIIVTDASKPIVATLDWTTTSANLNLFLTPPGTTTPAASETSKTARPETLTFQPAAPGTYKLRVKAAAGASAFTLDVSYGG
jgi:DNA-binding beta-propeller fold protein YncE